MMRQFSVFGFLLRKEFLQIRRNRMIMAVMLIMPVIQLIILANAADYEIRNIKLHVVDEAQSEMSGRMRARFEASPYFTLKSTSIALEPAMELIRANDVDIIVRLPHDLEARRLNSEPFSVQLLVNAINSAKAGLSVNYASAILQGFQGEVTVREVGQGTMKSGVQVTSGYLFNRDLNYQTFMVPGIIVILVTMVGMFLSALNIVREKEIGTIEQINVSPIAKTTFIAGKLIPFWIIGQVVLTVGLLVARFIFGIRIEHALLPIYLFSGVYLVLVLGIGLFISNISQSQQQAMLVTYFLMMVFLLMGGLFTPIESMPDWAQEVTRFNPVAYFIRVMRMVILKGSGLPDILNYLYGFLLCGMAMILFASATYRKRAA